MIYSNAGGTHALVESSLEAKIRKCMFGWFFFGYLLTETHFITDDDVKTWIWLLHRI